MSDIVIMGQHTGKSKSGGNYRHIRVDSSTEALLVNNYAHHEVHAGNSYFANHNVTLGNGDILGIGIITPDTTKWLHMALHVTATANGTMEVYEGGALSGGTAYTIVNQNRNSTNISVAVATTGSTGSNLITTTGTQIYGAGVASGSPIDWSRQAGEELILKQNTQYLFQIVNGVNANILGLTLRWYEHTNKN